MEAKLQCYEVLCVTILIKKFSFDYDMSLLVKYHVKDLEVIMSSNLSRYAHQEAICAGAIRQLVLLIQTFGACASLGPRRYSTCLIRVVEVRVPILLFREVKVRVPILYSYIMVPGLEQ